MKIFWKIKGLPKPPQHVKTSPSPNMVRIIYPQLFDINVCACNIVFILCRRASITSTKDWFNVHQVRMRQIVGKKGLLPWKGWWHKWLLLCIKIWVHKLQQKKPKKVKSFLWYQQYKLRNLVILLKVLNAMSWPRQWPQKD